MLNQNSSLSEITQSIRHINEVFLPSIKQKLSNKTHFGAEHTFNTLIDNIAVDKLGGKRWSSGMVRVTAGDTIVTGLGFTPSAVILSVSASNGRFTGCAYNGYRTFGMSNKYGNNLGVNVGRYEENGFIMNCTDSATYNMEWYAYE